MDNLRGFESSVAADYEVEDESAIEAPPAIGSDERRMHVRAYNHWVSLLDGRAYPSIEDLDPANIEDFGPHSVLLDFSEGGENPAISFIGRALREECALPSDITHISQVPSRSLLSRLTDHYLQIIANCAPIGFEAEFVSQRGHNTLYRGILMPLSSDGDTIDFIYGVINWKEIADAQTASVLTAEIGRAAKTPAIEASPVWADGPNSAPLDEIVIPTINEALPDDRAEEPLFPAMSLDGDAGLADRLSVARECADAVRHADHRSRTALYRALGEAYDFALAAQQAPEDFAELLEDAGLTFQARAPMTPVVKLVFGTDYDKARVTEYAAVLSFARRAEVPTGGLQNFVEAYAGGLKAVVQAERKLRRPARREDPLNEARERLRASYPLATLDVEAEEEFVLLVGRRNADGSYAVVGKPVLDRAIVERALRRAA